MRKPKKKIAEPVETEIQVTVTKDAGEFLDWVLSLPPGTKQTEEERLAVLKALDRLYPSENSKTS